MTYVCLDELLKNKGGHVTINSVNKRYMDEYPENLAPNSINSLYLIVKCLYAIGLTEYIKIGYRWIGVQGMIQKLKPTIINNDEMEGTEIVIKDEEFHGERTF
jgi:hypothetical protein